MDTDRAYYEGMEVGVNIVKSILSLDSKERIERFGKSDISSILDDFDFRQIENILSREIILKKHYVIRAITAKDGHKCIGESPRYSEYPSNELLLNFWSAYPDADFITVYELYTREFKQ